MPAVICGPCVIVSKVEAVVVVVEAEGGVTDFGKDAARQVDADRCLDLPHQIGPDAEAADLGARGGVPYLREIVAAAQSGVGRLGRKCLRSGFFVKGANVRRSSFLSRKHGRNERNNSERPNEQLGNASAALAFAANPSALAKISAARPNHMASTFRRDWASVQGIKSGSSPR